MSRLAAFPHSELENIVNANVHPEHYPVVAAFGGPVKSGSSVASAIPASAWLQLAQVAASVVGPWLSKFLVPLVRSWLESILLPGVAPAPAATTGTSAFGAAAHATSPATPAQGGSPPPGGKPSV